MKIHLVLSILFSLLTLFWIADLIWGQGWIGLLGLVVCSGTMVVEWYQYCKGRKK